MNTIVVGKWSKPKIVFIHGFGNSNALFFKIFEPLMKDYCLLLIDMIGGGASSRPKNFYKETLTAQEVLNYFINYIEVWRIKMKL
jgi:pimeloyl-ACP methyl ester carboxylesterase